MKKFVMSYSCGKDSTLALYRMIKGGNIPAGLLVTVKKDEDRSWFHGVPRELIEDVAKSLNIPLILAETKGDDYEIKFTEELLKAKEKFKIDSCVFGDIDLELHREWCTARCDEAGIEAIFPLWQENREELVYEFIDNGFKTVIKNVKLKCMGEDFLGKVLTKEVVKDIKETGSDACGENGEYHTFVYDGPIFKYPIKFEHSNIIKNETHGFLDVKESKNE
ncbi:diphthine--ammonia ligase [Clostridium sp. 1001271B_151109_B4]|uniref:Dph6-related ATP pyrophosphatase n=1 Tax=Clostridium sp. 1001271B_151109_B4 TaxID=2787148 RepID=UPI0018AB3C47|nr:diphthine--ammonia ligase [Clostridium sp. 1001271B_151109_B4]